MNDNDFSSFCSCRFFRKNTGILFNLLLSGLFFSQIAFFNHAIAQNKNYYFDPSKGNDNNTGISPNNAFKNIRGLKRLHVHPGDSILLKSGEVFFSPLFFSVKGIQGKPIVIGKYGGEVRPYFKGDASELEMVHIYNSENIVIRDLEISNKGNIIRPHLSGLTVELFNYGTAQNITIENIFVHDVYGSLIKGEGNKDKDAGGGQAINIINLRGGEHDSIPSCFDGLLVQDCYIQNCQRNGIMMWGNWARKYWFPSKHVIIRRNTVDGVPGDGIVPVACESPLVEYNVMKNSPATLPDTEACDGIWPFCCDNAVIQYNIVSDHHSIVDGYGLDADYNCNNSLFQYNLTYNNDGGFLLLCNSGGWPIDYSIGTRGTVVRYNLSINDGIRESKVQVKGGYFSPTIHITGPTENSCIHHNLFYIKKKALDLMDKRLICSDDWHGYADSTYFLHNYIYTEERIFAFDSTKSTNNFFEANKYVGSLRSPSNGFKAYSGKFDSTLWYDKRDTNWQKLIDFLKGKKILLAGKEMTVLKIIGWIEK